MIWSILIATLARREQQLAQVLEALGQQLALFSPMVEVVAYRNHGETPLPVIRQALVEEARGDYLCFVDDDDTLPPYYVDTILPMLDGTVDYVGWRMQAYMDGAALKPTYHTLDTDGWWETDYAYYRDVSHLNPVRTALARQADFRRVGDGPEDVSWADQMRPLLHTQHLCDGDRIMYHYYMRSADSTWRVGHEPPWDGATDLLTTPVVHRYDHIPAFRWHPAST